MVNSHTAVSTRKGFNYGDWFGFIVNEKQGKQESLNHFRITTNIADQNALQEQPHNIHKVNFLERYYNPAMKNCSAPSNVSEMERICSCSTFDRAEQFFIAELRCLSKKFIF